MKKLLPLLVVLVTAAPSSADIIIGPGDVSTNAYAGSNDSINTDLSNPFTLGPGTHNASAFNYLFGTSAGNSFTIAGSITPLVMVIVQPYTDIRPIAIGDAVPYNGPTPFMSTAFGGTATFTLTSTTTVYAGFYWHSDPNLQGDIRDPIPYIHEPGTNVAGYFSGASPPQLGVPISAPAMDTDTNLFAFSVTINAEPPSTVPEPASLLLALAGGVSLIGWRLKRGQQNRLDIVAKV